MSTQSSSRASLQTVLDALRSAELTDRRRQELIAAVRTVGRALDRPLADLPADPQALRRKLESVSPVAHGCSPGRWNNVRSLLNSALTCVRPMLPGRSIEPIAPEWMSLLEGLADGKRIRLQPLLRVLSRDGVGPGDVDLRHLEGYEQKLLADSLRTGPETTWRHLVWVWNGCVRDVEGWPRVTVLLPVKREIYSRPWSDFPASLKQEVDAFLKRLGGDTTDVDDNDDDDGPPRPVRPVTLERREYQLRVFASALVAQGRTAESITSIADLVGLAAYKSGLAFFLDRKKAREARRTQGEGDVADPSLCSSQIWNMATFLTSVARHWIKADDITLKAMSKIARKFALRRRSMTDKNRALTRQFDDDKAVARFLQAPWQMKAAADSGKLSVRRSAVTAQLALATAIVQMCPMRKHNLASISLERNIKRLGDRVCLFFPAHHVKNDEPLDYELPQEVVELLDWYCDRHRPALLDGPSDALFPGKGGKPKSKHTLGLQLKEFLFEYTGLRLHAHGFRHAAGKIYLDERPGEYAVVQDVLVHRDMATTKGAYVGEEKKRASKLYQETIIARRNRLMEEKSSRKTKAPPAPGLKRRKGSGGQS